MNEKRPLMVTFIGDMSFLAALLLMVIGVFPHFFARFGFYSTLPEGMAIPLSIILLIASVGFLRLKRWGYWLIVIYNVSYFMIYILGWLQNKQGFPISAIIGLYFIIPTRNYFVKKIPIS